MKSTAALQHLVLSIKEIHTSTTFIDTWQNNIKNSTPGSTTVLLVCSLHVVAMFCPHFWYKWIGSNKQRTRIIIKMKKGSTFMYTAATTNLTPSKITYSGVAGWEDVALYNTALFLGPWLSVGVGITGVADALSIRAAWQILPTVSKHQRAHHHSMGPCGEVVICIAVVVSTKPTHTTLKRPEHVIQL